MGITKEKYGTTPRGEIVYQYKIDNGNGLRAYILNYGGIITNLFVKDRTGKEVDVVLGWDKLEDYQTRGGYLGAAVGRNANRVAGAEFMLNGKKCVLAKNDGGNNLHGGNAGFNSKVWDVEEGENALIMRLNSPDGEEGFPGAAQVTMTYTLTPENGFLIHYEAAADQDTVFNMTNHSYFNLGGHASGDAGKLVLQMNSSFYTPNTNDCYPDGEVLSVTGTPFDFRAPKPLGQDWSADFDQIQKFGGYDHNFVIDGRGFRRAAILSCPENGITMDVFTDLPGIQVYTGNMFDEKSPGKGNATYHKHESICLETQYFPNAVNYAQFPRRFSGPVKSMIHRPNTDFL